MEVKVFLSNKKKTEFVDLSMVEDENMDGYSLKIDSILFDTVTISIKDGQVVLSYTGAGRNRVDAVLAEV